MIMLMPFQTTSSWEILGSSNAQVAYITASQCLTGVGREVMVRCGQAGRTITTKNVTAELTQMEGILTTISGFIAQLQGVGYFLGTLLLGLVGFFPTLCILAGLQVLMIGPILYFLPGKFARLDPAPKLELKRAMRLSAGATSLCLGHAVLLASRDVWYEIVLPIFLNSIAGWGVIVVGTLLASWSVVFATVQTAAAPLVLRAVRCSPPRAQHDWPWTLVLLACVFALALAFTLTNPLQSTIAVNCIIVPGVLVYAVAYAIDTTVHQSIVVSLRGWLNPAVVDSGMLLATSAGRIGGVLIGSALYTYFAKSRVVASYEGISASLTSFSSCLWFSVLSTFFLFLLALSTKGLLQDVSVKANDDDASNDDAAGAAGDVAGSSSTAGIVANAAGRDTISSVSASVSSWAGALDGV